MDYLRIEFDNPQAVYFPGQAVTGKVILKTQESIKARFMKICIQGDASTKWQEHEHHHRTDSQGRRDSLNEHVNYGSTINYLTGESTVWSSSDGTNKIQPGVSIFPFAFSLPTNCPPSFEGCHGHIKYSVHVELDRPWKWNKHTHQLFTVVPAYDLNITPEAVNPMMNTVSKNTGLLKKGGLLVMTVS
uniref:Arrestin_N domain-containing protein n=1 Tax=Caenorhabditis japonica TaxID=281687 RepID=A0A8R1I1J1_CAEJA